jgi:hypothetical protein
VSGEVHMRRRWFGGPVETLEGTRYDLLILDDPEGPQPARPRDWKSRVAAWFTQTLVAKP